VLDKRLAATPRAQRALARLADRPLNFDPVDLQGAGSNTGWHIDDYGQPLPAERPGEPVCGASFEIARRLMRDYAFADPAIVRAVFDPASDLANRNMLLEVRFGPLRCLLGCRIGAIVDEIARSTGGTSASGAGVTARLPVTSSVGRWSSQSGSGSTTDDGTVEFRIHVVSRRAQAGNPLVRLGYRLVGRRQQVRFARRACERMGERVELELAGARSAAVPPT